MSDTSGMLLKEALRTAWEASMEEPADTVDDLFEQWWISLQPIVDAINTVKEELAKCVRQSPEDE